MTLNMSKVEVSKVNSVGTWSCEIVDKSGNSNLVDLQAKKCTCKVYDSVKIPCGHALLAADSLGLAYGTLVGDCYKKPTWVATYEGVIKPHCDARDMEIPEDVKTMALLPPMTRRPSG